MNCELMSEVSKTLCIGKPHKASHISNFIWKYAQTTQMHHPPIGKTHTVVSLMNSAIMM